MQKALPDPQNGPQDPQNGPQDLENGPHRAPECSFREVIMIHQQHQISSSRQFHSLL